MDQGLGAEGVGAEYPKRGSHFAHKFTRHLAKRCAAQDIGPEGCWLVTVIAHTEDARRYTGAVTFYNEQLMPLCGFTAVSTFVRARQRAIEAGWLHYEAGAKRRAGKYWVRVPAYDQIDKEDRPIDETGELDSLSNCEGIRKESGGNPEGIRVGIARECEHPSTLVLNPSPIPNTNTCPPAGGRACDPSDAEDTPSEKPNASPRSPNDAAKPSRAAYPAAFERWYALYPRREGKQKAASAFGRAVSALASRFGGDRDGTVDWLCEVTVKFALSPKAKGSFCPHPSTWLNEGRFDDDRTQWERAGDAAANRAGPKRTGPGQRFDG